MRLAELVKTARANGLAEIELHPNGKLARVVFSPPIPVVTPKTKTTEEKLDEAKDERNPRRNSLDVALEALGNG